MKQVEEITIDLEAGKTLNLWFQAIGDTYDEGNIKIFSSSTVNP
jgi:pyruvate carboxylase